MCHVLLFISSFCVISVCLVGQSALVYVICMLPVFFVGLSVLFPNIFLYPHVVCFCFFFFFFFCPAFVPVCSFFSGFYFAPIGLHSVLAFVFVLCILEFLHILFLCNLYFRFRLLVKSSLFVPDAVSCNKVFTIMPNVTLICKSISARPLCVCSNKCSTA